VSLHIDLIADDSSRIATEAHNGITTQIIKTRLFNTPLGETVDPATAGRAAAGVL